MEQQELESTSLEASREQVSRPLAEKKASRVARKFPELTDPVNYTHLFTEEQKEIESKDENYTYDLFIRDNIVGLTSKKFKNYAEEEYKKLLGNLNRVLYYNIDLQFETNRGKITFAMPIAMLALSPVLLSSFTDTVDPNDIKIDMVHDHGRIPDITDNVVHLKLVLDYMYLFSFKENRDALDYVHPDNIVLSLNSKNIKPWERSYLNHLGGSSPAEKFQIMMRVAYIADHFELTTLLSLLGKEGKNMITGKSLEEMRIITGIREEDSGFTTEQLELLKRERQQLTSK